MIRVGLAGKNSFHIFDLNNARSECSGFQGAVCRQNVRVILFQSIPPKSVDDAFGLWKHSSLRQKGFLVSSGHAVKDSVHPNESKSHLVASGGVHLQPRNVDPDCDLDGRQGGAYFELGCPHDCHHPPKRRVVVVGV
jgi:hypothetical protein